MSAAKAARRADPSGADSKSRAAARRRATGVPEASSEAARARLQRQAQRNTKPEIALRRSLHRSGLRYLVDAPLPLTGVRRRADLLFRGSKVAVFVDGCYWHACPIHATKPRQNADWWSAKFAANVARDRDTDRRMAEVGWAVVRVWEHEDPHDAAEHVRSVVRGRTDHSDRAPRSTRMPDPSPCSDSAPPGPGPSR